jgi:hypothetical protein
MNDHAKNIINDSCEKLRFLAHVAKNAWDTQALEKWMGEIDREVATIRGMIQVIKARKED